MNDRLLSAAYDLCVEMRESPRWEAALNRVGDTEGLEELRRRCPGYTEQEYVQAIANGMMASR